MWGVNMEEFQRRLFEAGKQLENPPLSETELLEFLENVETYLSIVHHAPPESLLLTAMLPSMEALVKPELMRHDDKDVTLLVTNCLSQITKITAPEKPYNDDLMKDIFVLIVETFQELGEMNNPSFERRVAILKSVAEVRSCVVMVDLGLNAALLDMFKHFFAAVSQNPYSADVYDSMKTIMVSALDESDDISQELLSVLLINLRGEMKDSSPVAHSLASAVVASCAEKLRPYLKVKFPSDQATICNCYPEVIYDICRFGSQETAPTQEVMPTQNSTAGPAASSELNDSNSQAAICQLFPSDIILDKKKHDNKKKNEADLRLVSLFSHIPLYPFADTCELNRGRPEKRSDLRLVSLFSHIPLYPFADACGLNRGSPEKRSRLKEEESMSTASAETGYNGVDLPDYTTCESTNYVAVFKSSKRKRTSRNSPEDEESVEGNRDI